MADETIIAWTDHTFNPWMGCSKVSDGCRNCYAVRLGEKTGRQHLWGHDGLRQRTSTVYWTKPHSWNKLAANDGVRSMVFCGSMCDVFEQQPTLRQAREDLFALIKATPRLDWQLLTKRPENIRSMLPQSWGHGWPNVWLGTSVEDMRVSERVDHLRGIPAAVRFISYEPALGPLDDLDLTGLDWVIYGGESGPRFRPHDLSWPRTMRVKCAASGIAYFFKQSAAIRTEMGTTLDGETLRAYPTPRR